MSDTEKRRVERWRRQAKAWRLMLAKLDAIHAGIEKKKTAGDNHLTDGMIALVLRSVMVDAARGAGIMPPEEPRDE